MLPSVKVPLGREYSYTVVLVATGDVIGIVGDFLVWVIFISCVTIGRLGSSLRVFPVRTDRSEWRVSSLVSLGFFPLCFPGPVVLSRVSVSRNFPVFKCGYSDSSGSVLGGLSIISGR